MTSDQAPDWHDAQVIEATAVTGRFILSRYGTGGRVWFIVGGAGEYAMTENLSDVRVIVDRDGRIAPPAITDEMVETVARSIFGGDDQIWASERLKGEHDHMRSKARAALGAALDGQS